MLCVVGLRNLAKQGTAVQFIVYKGDTELVLVADRSGNVVAIPTPGSNPLDEIVGWTGNSSADDDDDEEATNEQTKRKLRSSPKKTTSHKAKTSESAAEVATASGQTGKPMRKTILGHLSMLLDLVSAQYIQCSYAVV